LRYGYFDNDNREYVIDRVDTPTPWTNYIGVNDMCAVLSQTAGGYMFRESPQNHRVTRFRPNAPIETPGHYVYIRDDDTGEYWSVSWQPTAKDLSKARYICRHGLSYSKYECDYNGVTAAQTIFIPLGEPVELWDVVLKNISGRARRISVFSYIEFSFHFIDMDNQNFQMSLYCSGSEYKNGVIEYNLFYEGAYQWFAGNFSPDGFDCLRDAFLGAYRNERAPLAVERGECFGSFEKCGNHCAALHKRVTLEPGGQARLIFMLGDGSPEEGLNLRQKYSVLNNVDAAFKSLAAFWDEKLAKQRVHTPNEGMNTSLNIWNLYQAEVNIMFSRFASFIEVGGRTGLGYRDTSQDAMCVIHSNPEKCRRRIIELLRGLTNAGYGLHLFQPEWFDPHYKAESFKSPTIVPDTWKEALIHGVDDACSDDALWLTGTIAEYIKETGDTEFLNETVTFADGGEASVYEHIKRILDFSDAQTGADGICKGLRADWNDCLNLGGGESAMVSFLHYWAINHFIDIIKYTHGPDSDLVKYTTMAERVKRACDEHLWDGEWFIRGFTASGRKIGSRLDSEGMVHIESNSWAVLSGLAGGDRARDALNAVDKYLYTDYGLMINAPSYTVRDDEIGFVTRVYPGVKENGSIFSHPNPWVWCAEAVIGNGERAMRYYNALLPYNQNDLIEIRRAEPYSYCQFIMGKEHASHGRANHPFMTGSGGWAYFAATHYLLGVRPGYDRMDVDPCIPPAWDGFSVSRVWRDARYEITVENHKHVSKGVSKIYVDGEETDHIPVRGAGEVVQVRVIMG
jgi:N,N'-diacetylchitobiose phosphorylase